MNEKLERMLTEYPQMVLERDTLKRHLDHFKGITAEEVIESMCTPRNDGERVRTSTIVDETSQIAMNYQEQMRRINSEWYTSLAMELVTLENDIVFFESALASLPAPLADMMQDMYIHHVVWDALEDKYRVCRMTLNRYRNKALEMLSRMYDRYMV